MDKAKRARKAETLKQPSLARAAPLSRPHLEGAAMLDFTETKLFGAGCVGLSTLGTSYIAGLDSGSVIALSLLALLAYHLFFRERSLVYGQLNCSGSPPFG
jgi:hypothetical protein